jgi:chromosome segregation ATPase
LEIYAGRWVDTSVTGSGCTDLISEQSSCSDKTRIALLWFKLKHYKRMGDPAIFDMNKLTSYSDDLIQFLKTDNDHILLKQFLQHLQALHSQCNSDYNHLRSLIEEYQMKIDTCKQKITTANSETAADEETEMLLKELDEEFQKEHLLREELRVTTDEINGLDHQRTPLEERRQAIKKLEKEDLRTERKLSMYASVTCIIPNLEDDQSKISGQIVEKDKKEVEYFELDTETQSSFQTCNSIWKRINI